MTCNLNSILIEQSINYILHFSDKFSIKYTSCDMSEKYHIFKYGIETC